MSFTSLILTESHFAISSSEAEPASFDIFSCRYAGGNYINKSLLLFSTPDKSLLESRIFVISASISSGKHFFPFVRTIIDLMRPVIWMHPNSSDTPHHLS
jgi:hypothetical protein